MSEPSYDAYLARVTAEHMDGPAWEGRPVELYRSENDWQGLGPCELTISVEAGSVEGFVVEATTDEGDPLSIKHVLAPQRWVKLTQQECADAELAASEEEVADRDEAAERRAEMQAEQRKGAW